MIDSVYFLSIKDKGIAYVGKLSVTTSLRSQGNINLHKSTYLLTMMAILGTYTWCVDRNLICLFGEAESGIKVYAYVGELLSTTIARTQGNINLHKSTYLLNILGIYALGVFEKPGLYGVFTVQALCECFYSYILRIL